MSVTMCILFDVILLVSCTGYFSSGSFFSSPPDFALKLFIRLRVLLQCGNLPVEKGWRCQKNIVILTTFYTTYAFTHLHHLVSVGVVQNLDSHKQHSSQTMKLKDVFEFFSLNVRLYSLQPECIKKVKCWI